MQQRKAEEINEEEAKEEYKKIRREGKQTAAGVFFVLPVSVC